MQGLVKSSWKLKGKELEWEITMPPNTLADLYIPAFKPGEIKVPEGFRSLGFKDGKEVYEAQPGTYLIISRIRK